MKRAQYIWILSLFLTLFSHFCEPRLYSESFSEENADEETESLLIQGDEYLFSGLYHRALPIFEKIYSQSPQNTKIQALSRLKVAQCYYFMGQFPKVISTIPDVTLKIYHTDKEIQHLQLEGQLLLGLAHSKMENYEEAKTVLNQYLSQSDSEQYHEEARYELAISLYYLGQYSEATKHFQVLSNSESTNRLGILSQLYLARIAISEEKYTLAENLISRLSLSTPPEDILIHALNYLRGEIAFRQEEYNQAIIEFKKALPKRNKDKAEWYSDNLYHLGWSYLKSAENSDSESEKRLHYNDAIEVFSEMIENVPSDKGYLSLGQSYLSKGKDLSDQESLKKLEKLLSQRGQLKTREAQLHALIIRAEASSSYAHRKKLFSQLTSEVNWDSPFFTNAWYLRGLNELEYGEFLVAESKIRESKKHFDQAVTALNKAFQLLISNNPKLAALCLKYQSKAHYAKGTREGYLKALSCLSKLLEENRDHLFSLIEQPDEIYYLRGLYAFELVDGEDSERYYNIAAQSLKEGSQMWKDGSYYNDSMMLLGVLDYRLENYQQAKATFQELSSSTTSDNFKAEGLFWASCCSEEMEEEPQVWQSLRKLIYEEHPNSKYSDEAYFRYYPYHDYISGKPEALDHLKTLGNRFPYSPYVINSSYLVALNQQKEGMEKAIKSFQKSSKTFDALNSQGLIPEERLEELMTIKFRSHLDRAKSYIALSDKVKGVEKTELLQKAEDVLFQVYLDLQNQEMVTRTSHKNSRKVVQDVAADSFSNAREHCRIDKARAFEDEDGVTDCTNFPIFCGKCGSISLHEEIPYNLVKCLSKAKKEMEAERILMRMFDRYKHSTITRGYYLSRAWYEKGKISFHRNEPEQALNDFQRAEETGKGQLLSTEELLDLWIQKSRCYVLLNNLDESMLILSKVINYDAVSSQRVKAMYLRAEIYEGQNRYELARRQLEATATKGGEWSVRAKQKLEKDYDYQ